MNIINRKRILAKMHLQKSIFDLVKIIILLIFINIITISIVYYCVSNNDYSILRNKFFSAVVLGSIILSFFIFYIWRNTPKIYLIGLVAPRWQTTITHFLRKIGYELTDSNSHSLSFIKSANGLKDFLIRYLSTKCVIIEDEEMLYACMWTEHRQERAVDIIPTGKSEIRLIKEALYTNKEKNDESQSANLKLYKQTDKGIKLEMEFLHADNSIEKFSVTEPIAVKKVLSWPWDSELTEAESLKRVSPTVSLTYSEKKYNLWASVIHKVGDDFEFIVCLQHKKIIEGKKKSAELQEQDVQVAQADAVPISKLPELFHLFYTGDFDTLAKKIDER